MGWYVDASIEINFIVFCLLICTRVLFVYSKTYSELLFRCAVVCMVAALVVAQKNTETINVCSRGWIRSGWQNETKEHCAQGFCMVMCAVWKCMLAVSMTVCECVWCVWMCRETKLCFRCEYRSKTDVVECLFCNVMRVQNSFCLQTQGKCRDGKRQ